MEARRDHYHAIVHVGARRVRAPNGTRYRGHVRTCTLSCGHRGEYDKTARSTGYSFCFDCYYGKCAECLAKPGRCVCDEGPTVCAEECCARPARALRKQAKALERQAEIEDTQRYAAVARYLEAKEQS